MPMPPVGFVGQSDIAEDEIRASCSLKYHGSQKPRFQWRWSDNSMVSSTEEDNESTTVVSKVMTQPRQELNGAKLTCTVSVSVSDGSETQDSSATVQWTSHQVTVLRMSSVINNFISKLFISICLVCAYSEKRSTWSFMLKSTFKKQLLLNGTMILARLCPA